jgi:transcriptional regulator with XRE-family HTH domain
MSNNSDILKKAVANRLRELRDKLNLKQEELAQQLGCSRSNLSQIENELFLPSAGLLDELKSKLKVRLDWLFSGEGPMFTDEMERDLEMLDFGKDTDDIKLMLAEMKKSPAIKYRVLSDFFAYLGIKRLKEKENEQGNNGGNNGVNNDD